MPVVYRDAASYSSFEGRDILDFKLEAFVDDGTITNLHDFTTQFEWSESLEDAAVRGTATFYDPKKRLNIRYGVLDGKDKLIRVSFLVQQICIL